MLAEKNTPACPFKKHALTHTLLKWTAPKAYLIELMYALDVTGCFNSGKVSLNKIAVYFEEVFNIDLSNYSRDFYEMRIRNNRTPLLDMLHKLIILRMNNPKQRHKIVIRDKINKKPVIYQK